MGIEHSQISSRRNKHRLTCILFCCLYLVLPAFGGNIPKTEIIPADDGAALSADVYLPAEEGKFPCVLIRTPYDKTGHRSDADAFLKHGIAVVAVDCRGRFLSGGDFYPFANERRDGQAAVNWVRSQSWSNGKVAGWGGSYVGYTQLSISYKLDAMALYKTGSDIYGLIYPEGLFSLELAFYWGFAKDGKTDNKIPPEKLAESHYILPLSVADDRTYRDNTFINDWLSHPDYDSYWQLHNRRREISCPVISVAGWYDIFLMNQIRDFQARGENAHPADRLIIGPWAHGQHATKNDFGGEDKTGRTNELMRTFIINHLKGESAEFIRPPFKDNAYNLFIMGLNEYYGCYQWPPNATTFTKFYLGADSYLGTDIPAHETFAQYVYNPADPYPSRGGTTFAAAIGQALQNDNVTRPDQAVFETAALESPLTLLGPLEAVVYVSTDAPCTDFFVLLQDVCPDGRIVNIQEGGKTVRFETAEVKETRIPIWATGYQLGIGHKLRAVITSSWFPRFNRNLNSGQPLFEADTIKPANQKIHLGPNHPSHLILPLLNFDDNPEK